MTAGEIRNAVEPWATDVNMVKAITRCGMGYCQGRICGPLAEAIVAASLDRPPGSVGSFHARAPIKPIPARALAGYAQAPDGRRDFAA